MPNVKFKRMFDEEENKEFFCIMIPIEELITMIAGRYDFGDFGRIIKKFIGNISGVKE